MPRRRRLSEIERSTIAQERRNGVSAASLAARYDVSLKTIYNVVNHRDERQTANGSRSRVVGIRVSDDDLRRFDAALSRRGIVHRSDAMRRLMLAAEGAFLPDDEMNRIIALQIEACAQFGVDEIALREMIATARKLGYALVDGKIITGMSAVGVPICRDDGMPIAAVSVAAISSRMRSPRQENIVANLREEVARIEADLKPLLTSGNFTFDLLRVGTT